MQRQRHSATRSLGCHRDAAGVGAGYQRCEGLLFDLKSKGRQPRHSIHPPCGVIGLGQGKGNSRTEPLFECIPIEVKSLIKSRLRVALDGGASWAACWAACCAGSSLAFCLASKSGRAVMVA